MRLRNGWAGWIVCMPLSTKRTNSLTAGNVRRPVPRRLPLYTRSRGASMKKSRSRPFERTANGFLLYFHRCLPGTQRFRLGAPSRPGPSRYPSPRSRLSRGTCGNRGTKSAVASSLQPTPLRSRCAPKWTSVLHIRFKFFPSRTDLRLWLGIPLPCPGPPSARPRPAATKRRQRKRREHLPASPKRRKCSPR